MNNSRSYHLKELCTRHYSRHLKCLIFTVFSGYLTLNRGNINEYVRTQSIHLDWPRKSRANGDPGHMSSKETLTWWSRQAYQVTQLGRREDSKTGVPDPKAHVLLPLSKVLRTVGGGGKAEGGSEEKGR